jgi:hypothetical protein
MGSVAKFLMFSLIILACQISWASDYADYIDAKNENLERDKAYLEHLKSREAYAAESAAGLRTYKKTKAWTEWRAEYARRLYVFKRDRRDRQPASVLEAEERKYDQEHAAAIAEIERDRQRFIRLREIRNRARMESWAFPLSEKIKTRNLEPWNE